MTLIRTLFAGMAALAVVMPAAAQTPAAASKSAAAPAQYTLRYKFQAGEAVRWNVVHQATIKTTVSGTTQTAETMSRSVKLWRVGSVGDDGSAVFEHMVESVDMSQKLTGRQEVRYNSQKDEKAPPGFETVAASVGKPLTTITLDPTGKVLKRERHDVPGAAPSDGQITLPFPVEAVAVGDSWVMPSDINVPLPAGGVKKIKAQQRFKLTAVNDDLATIQVSTQILTPVSDPAIEAYLIQRESTGTVRFDIQSGRVVGQQMDLDKQVVGFRGQASSLHYVTRFTEELVAAPQVAGPAKPADTRTE